MSEILKGAKAKVYVNGVLIGTFDSVSWSKAEPKQEKIDSGKRASTLKLKGKKK